MIKRNLNVRDEKRMIVLANLIIYQGIGGGDGDRKNNVSANIN